MKWRDCVPRPEKTERLNPTREQLRAMQQENKRFPVDRLVEIPRAEWPHHRDNLIRALRNRDFLVQVFAEPGDVVRLSIQRCAFDRASGRWVDGITWDDLQHLKTLAGYGDRVGLEVYPPDRDVVNVANLRHLWLVPDVPAFMWRRA
ncbi:hypothetical protein [Erythrobacter sp. CCH5-A1]|jgi:hypothetical protein|uniref:DUF7694 domain-containing protein n=1 Tax=Erythrobacter sp. CCH5-A1 TaxID=1768792 RepID=UPI0009E6D8EF|nr:hypothetical protein [Erythrobacter sp. CCH5-A1]